MENDLERIVAEEERVSGVVTMASYGNSLGCFVLKTDTGAEYEFNVSAGHPTAPKPQDEGQRWTVWFSRVAYKQGGVTALHRFREASPRVLLSSHGTGCRLMRVILSC